MKQIQKIGHTATFNGSEVYATDDAINHIRRAPRIMVMATVSGMDHYVEIKRDNAIAVVDRIHPKPGKAIAHVLDDGTVHLTK